MKKAILILFMIISCFNAKCAWSDICYEIKENAIARAEEILKHQKKYINIVPSVKKLRFAK